MSLTMQALPFTENPGPLLNYSDPLWYAIYTAANREKRIAEQLETRSLENFLPLYSAVSRRKDRRVELQRPLFPGYVFVRLALRDRLQVLRIPGVVKFVGFCGQPAPLPQEEMESLQRGLKAGIHADPHPFLTVGRRVRVKSGPLAEMEGILVRRKNRDRLVISFDLIERSVAVEVSSHELERV